MRRSVAPEAQKVSAIAVMSAAPSRQPSTGSRRESAKPSNRTMAIMSRPWQNEARRQEKVYPKSPFLWTPRPKIPLKCCIITRRVQKACWFCCHRSSSSWDFVKCCNIPNESITDSVWFSCFTRASVAKLFKLIKSSFPLARRGSLGKAANRLGISCGESTAWPSWFTTSRSSLSGSSGFGQTKATICRWSLPCAATAAHSAPPQSNTSCRKVSSSSCNSTRQPRILTWRSMRPKTTSCERCHFPRSPVRYNKPSSGCWTKFMAVRSGRCQ